MHLEPSRTTAKDRLLDVALHVLRAKGYSATTVDELCGAAGVTKGAFFHHFTSKEDLAIAAAQHWSDVTGELFAAADYHTMPDARDRILGYLDFRIALLRGDIPEFTCLVGTMVQEVYATHPNLRAACADSITGHAATLESDLAEALVASGAGSAGEARDLALHTQAVLQGSFILAKATEDVGVAARSVAHLRHYLALLFGREAPRLAFEPDPRKDVSHDRNDD